MNNLTPKADFKADAARADRHMEIMMSPDMQIACKTALLHYLLAQSTSDPKTAWRMEGAKGFVYELLNLGHESKPFLETLPEQLTAI